MSHEFATIRPPGGFRVILADPPWLFETFSAKGLGKSAQRHYDCMPTDEIAAMPVELLAAKHCTLFLWCTWPLMLDWPTVIEAWGFKFTGLAWEWIKFNPETGKHAFGGGYGTRKNLEPCLLATRGSPSLRKGYAADLFSDGHEPEGVRSVRDFIYAMLPPRARAAIDWQVFVVIGSAFGLGAAMESSGLAELIAGATLSVVQPMGLVAVLGAIYLMTAIFTNVVTNNEIGRAHV